MNKHSPWPWYIWKGYNHIDEIEFEITTADGQIVIARLNFLIEEGMANARLIAAAPELLTLLEEARMTLEMWKDVAPTVSLCADIDAVIAKVKGEKL